jgi:hypothetical protein
MTTPEKRAEYSRRYREKNREKCNLASKASRRKHPETDIEGHLLRSYGITLKKYQALVEKQDGKCAICHGPPNGRVKKLVVDHNHETGKIRELLCDGCNRAIGFMKDDPEQLRAAALYLEKNE